MKTTIDLRSALLGFTAGLAVVMLVGAAGVPAAGTGRYQIKMGSGDVGLIVDTTTGQVWRHRSLGSGNNDADFFKPKQ